MLIDAIFDRNYQLTDKTPSQTALNPRPGGHCSVPEARHSGKVHEDVTIRVWNCLPQAQCQNVGCLQEE